MRRRRRLRIRYKTAEACRREIARLTGACVPIDLPVGPMLASWRSDIYLPQIADVIEIRRDR